MAALLTAGQNGGRAVRFAGAWHALQGENPTSVLGRVALGDDPSRRGVVVVVDTEAMLSVSAVRTEEGVLRIVVVPLLLLEPNGEGGGVKNCGDRGGDDDDDDMSLFGWQPLL